MYSVKNNVAYIVIFLIIWKTADVSAGTRPQIKFCLLFIVYCPFGHV